MKISIYLLILMVALPVRAQDKKKEPDKAKTPSISSKRCDDNTCTYPLDSEKGSSGDVVRGPRTIVATGINGLRYDYLWNNVVSFGAAPDLWSKLTSITTSTTSNPPAPAQKEQTKLAGGEQIPAEIKPLIDSAEKLITDTAGRTKSINDYKMGIQTDADDLRTQQRAAAKATADVTTAGKALTDFLSTSGGVPSVLIPQITDQLADTDAQGPAKATMDSLFIVGTKAVWSDQSEVKRLQDQAQPRASQLDAVKTDFSTYVPQQTAVLESSKTTLNALIASLQREALTASADRRQRIQLEIPILDNEANVNLKNAQNDLANANQLLTNWEIPTNTQISTALSDLDTTSSKYVAFRTAQDALITWKRKMQTLLQQWANFQAHPDATPNPFSIQIHADCGFAFARTKTNTLTLSRTDRMPGNTATSPETVLSLSVECTSPFTVSAGVAYIFKTQKEFGIQSVPVTQTSGTATTANEIVATTNSRFYPVPIGVVHARVWEPNDWFSIHASFGLAAVIRSQSAGGSDPAYLIGPSFTLFRTMFFTPGAVLAPQANLGTGFNEGQTVPSTITTPPLQKTYRGGFSLAVTFTKP